MIDVSILIYFWMGSILATFFTTFIIWGYVFITNLRLINYLRIKKPKRFKEVFIKSFNPFGTLYFENNLDIKDGKILHYKKRLRFAAKIAITFLIASVILFFGGIFVVMLFKI